MSKYDDCHRVDNRYTTAIGMSVWRFFNIGKYKNQKVKDVCYFRRVGRQMTDSYHMSSKRRAHT